MRRSADGTITELTPAPNCVRSRVHEYGGGAYLVTDDYILFSNDTDRRLYKLTKNGPPCAVTPPSALRFSDGAFNARTKTSVWVVEDHTVTGKEPENYLAQVDENGEVRPIVRGHDFFAGPRFSADGTKLCWLTWDHPNMPWDGTELWVADFTDGKVGKPQLVAGGKSESVIQPEWSPDNQLFYLSDRSNWWNLYRWTGTKSEALCPKEAEFGGPLWSLGETFYAVISPDELLTSYNEKNFWSLGRLNLKTRELTRLENPFTEISRVGYEQGKAVYVAGSPRQPLTLVCEEISTGRRDEIQRAMKLEFPPEHVSEPERIEYRTTGGKTSHAFFYPPRNADYTGKEGQRPPLLVISHGGPTGASYAHLDPNFQFWTNRGFAILDVNYRGSTGYGRKYRSELNGQWGVADVEDCIEGAKYLAAKGLVDENRVAIRGGSAGGFTTLCALTFHKYFKAGASYFGVSDVEALAKDTHKFEARYDQSLIGDPKSGLYYERSPIHFVDKIECPLIFFQGLEDKVVPPNQAEHMVEALRGKGLPVAYLAYEGEGHGFRRADSLESSLNAELYFYSRLFHFTPADKLQPIPIDNLD